MLWMYLSLQGETPQEPADNAIKPSSHQMNCTHLFAAVSLLRTGGFAGSVTEKSQRIDTYANNSARQPGLEKFTWYLRIKCSATGFELAKKAISSRVRCLKRFKRRCTAFATCS